MPESPKTLGRNGKLTPLHIDRLLIAKLMNDLEVIFRDTAARVRPEIKSASHLRALHAVYRTILIGHFEGKPYSANKIGLVLGMPRTSVLKRIEVLIVCGMVKRQGNVFCLTDAYFHGEVVSPIDSQIVHASTMANRAAAAVLKTAEQLRRNGHRSVKK